MWDWLGDYTFRTVILGTGVLGLVCGVLGCIAVLRRQSLVGDAMAHAALPGVCLAFLVTGSRGALGLMIGAGVTAVLAVLLVGLAKGTKVTDQNSALATSLTVFFGLGVVLLSIVQRSPSGAQAGLDKLLFGQAASLVQGQVVTIGLVGVVAVGVFLLFMRPFKLLAFDPVFAKTAGHPVGVYSGVFTGLLVVAVVVGLNTVGVILLSAMLVAPGVAARQFTDRLGWMLGLAGVFGMGLGLLGAGLSMAWDAPTGPVVVILSGVWVVASLLAGPFLKGRSKNRLVGGGA